MALNIIILFLHREHTHLPLDKYIHHCGLLTEYTSNFWMTSTNKDDDDDECKVHAILTTELF